MLMLSQTDAARHHNICTVYSNFSLSGLFYLDKYPADLVVIFDNGQMQVYQFDSHFVHGCNICASLLPMWWRKFANGQTHKQVCLKTLQCNKTFGEWVSSLNMVTTMTNVAAAANAVHWVEYVVISNCHFPGYSPWGLDKAFQTDPVLAQLEVSYQMICGENRLERIRQRKRRRGGVCEGGDVTLELWLNFMKREEENESFTCIVWLKGFCPETSAVTAAAAVNPAANGCLISFLSLLGSGGSKLLTNALTEPVVLIQDYFRYLVLSHSFVVTNLKAVVFFKTEPIFNQIFW